MQYKFLNIFLDPKELLSQAKDEMNPFLIQNNTSQIEKLYNFYKSDTNMLYVNGFIGTGKAKIVDYSLSFLSKDAIILKYNCFNSTVLDDILLYFFSQFKNLSAQNIISEPKMKTENFTQKVNSYFSQIEKPFVIIIDSFEAILDENRQKILDFILHLNTFQKIKTIIIGRTFEEKYFKNVGVEKVTTFALEKEIFQKFLKSEKVKAPSAIIDEFYKYTKGYYFFTALSLNLMKNESLSLVDFLTKFANTYLPFTDYIGKQALTLIEPSEKNLFYVLSLIRHPISVNLLKKLNLYNEAKINFLTKNLIIIEDVNQLYMQDYIKEFSDESIPPGISQRVRQYIIDLYLTQLPLKPLERNICISRQTMRKEIEYHKFFLPKKPKNIENETIDINYLSYAKTLDFGEVMHDETKPTEGKNSVASASDSGIDMTQRKNIKINIENLPYQQSAIEAKADFVQEETPMSLGEIIEKAKIAETKYHYTKVIELLKKALLLKEDKSYQSNLALIYNKLAHAYQKNANYDEALKYYNLLQNLYKNANDLTKSCHIKFNTSKILYETYQVEKAKENFLEIIRSKESPKILQVKSYLQLANIEEGLSNSQSAFEYYKKAIELSDSSMDIETLSETYFKYALALDDKNDTKTALEYYNKCIELGNNEKNSNKFLSPTYSNLATLYLEKNDTQHAIESYSKAYEIDKENNNIEGMYYSASKLAEMTQKIMPEKAIEYFNAALDCAKSTQDVFYMVSASLALGDFNYDRSQSETALKHYIYALDLAKTALSQENIDKINIRINDIKFKLGVEKFEKLVEIIRQ